jgi:hypothetical protein
MGRTLPHILSDKWATNVYAPTRTMAMNTPTFGTHCLCCNPTPCACDQSKGLQRCGPRVSPGITFHAPESAGKCEGMNPNTPK